MDRPRLAFLSWLVLTALGAVLVAFPDDDRRVVSFTDGHGPAALDLAGISIVCLGTVAYVLGVVWARDRVRRQDVAVALAAYVPSMGLTAWSVATDTGWWWAGGVAVALAAHAFLAWKAV